MLIGRDDISNDVIWGGIQIPETWLQVLLIIIVSFFSRPTARAPRSLSAMPN